MSNVRIDIIYETVQLLISEIFDINIKLIIKFYFKCQLTTIKRLGFPKEPHKMK